MPLLLFRGDDNCKASRNFPHLYTKKPRTYLQGYISQTAYDLPWSLSKMPHACYCRSRLVARTLGRKRPTALQSKANMVAYTRSARIHSHHTIMCLYLVYCETFMLLFTEEVGPFTSAASAMASGSFATRTPKNIAADSHQTVLFTISCQYTCHQLLCSLRCSRISCASQRAFFSQPSALADGVSRQHLSVRAKSSSGKLTGQEAGHDSGHHLLFPVIKLTIGQCISQFASMASQRLILKKPSHVVAVFLAMPPVFHRSNGPTRADFDDDHHFTTIGSRHDRHVTATARSLKPHPCHHLRVRSRRWLAHFWLSVLELAVFRNRNDVRLSIAVSESFARLFRHAGSTNVESL